MSAAESSELLPLDFRGGGTYPVQYFADHGGRSFYIRYRNGLVSIDVDDMTVFEDVIGGDLDGVWNDEETNVYLSVIGEAIINDSLAALAVPKLIDTRTHPEYRKGKLPTHPVGIVCGRKDAVPITAANRNKRKLLERAGVHSHDPDCYEYVAARDIAQWIAEHPEEHQLLRTDSPALWNDYLRTQASWIDDGGTRHLPPP